MRGGGGGRLPGALRGLVRLRRRLFDGWGWFKVRRSLRGRFVYGWLGDRWLFRNRVVHCFRVESRRIFGWFFDGGWLGRFLLGFLNGLGGLVGGFWKALVCHGGLLIHCPMSGPLR